MTFDELVDRVVAQFDCTQPQAVAWGNERHRRMVGEANWRLAERDFGNTLVGITDYDLPEDVDNVSILMLGADTDPLAHVSVQDMATLRAGGRLNGADAAYTIYADANGVKKFRIWPAPDTAGIDILGFTAIDPAAMAYGTGASPIIPVQFHPYLKDGMFADALEEVENRWDLAQPFELRYEQGIERLRRHKSARAGGGTQQIVLDTGR